MNKEIFLSDFKVCKARAGKVTRYAIVYCKYLQCPINISICRGCNIPDITMI